MNLIIRIIKAILGRLGKGTPFHLALNEYFGFITLAQQLSSLLMEN